MSDATISVGARTELGASARRPLQLLSRAVLAAAAGVYLAFALLLAFNARNGLDPAGSPLGYDFSAFHTAARLAWDGHAAAAYDDPTMVGAEQAAFPGSAARLPWNYPPTFLLMLLPFAALPYAWAWAVWSALLLGAFVALAKLTFPRRAVWPILLSPAVALNLFLGQNGLLTAALLGAGVSLLSRRPVVAGLALSAIAYKPQLALVVPLVLVAGREWRVLGAAVMSAAGLAAASVAAFGIAPWQAFLRKSGDAAAVASASSSDWHAVPNTLVMLTDLGVAAPYAGWIHAAVGVVAAIVAMSIWAKRAGRAWRAAALALAALIAAPYVRVYDFALLAFPIAALSSTPPTDWRGKTATALLWLTPALLFAMGRAVPVGPLVLIAALALVSRRATL